MSGQMNLLAPPSDGPIEVPITRRVLYSGADACTNDGEAQLFPHRHVPPVPPKLPDEAAWLAALDYAETELRYERSPRAILDLDGPSRCTQVGGRAGPSSPRLWCSSRGIEVNGDLATWAQLFKGRREQREIEIEVARARDLAAAYHLLDYFGRVYGEDTPYSRSHEEWTPVPLIRRLAEEAVAVGGAPTLLEVHTDYMRQGIEEAIR